MQDCHKSAGTSLGIDEDAFGGRYAWRHLFVTNMVDPLSVSGAESMAAARHRSVSDHVGCREIDIVSEEGDGALVLIQKNNISAASTIINKRKQEQSPLTQKVEPIATNGIDSPSSDNNSES